MPTFGEVLNSWTVTPRRYPFQKKQIFKVTGTWAPDGLVGNPRRETMVVEGEFMSVIQKAQAKWPGASISVTTLGLKSELPKEKDGV